MTTDQTPPLETTTSDACKREIGWGTWIRSNAKYRISVNKISAYLRYIFRPDARLHEPTSPLIGHQILAYDLGAVKRLPRDFHRALNLNE